MKSRDDVRSHSLNDRVRGGHGGRAHNCNVHDVHRAYARDGRVRGGHVHRVYAHGVHAHKSNVHRGYVRDDRDDRDGRVHDDHVHGGRGVHAHKSNVHRGYVRDVHAHGGHDVLHDCAHACVRFLFLNPFTCPP